LEGESPLEPNSSDINFRDHVETSNLNRQQYFSNQIGLPKVRTLQENLLRINPELKINAV